MNINKKSLLISFVIVILALSLFVGTSLIPRNGNYVVHGAEYGDSAHRDVRGIPFVLKRSLADGECDIHDVQIQICNPDEGNEPHELILGALILDIVLWLLITSAVFALTTHLLQIRF